MLYQNQVFNMNEPRFSQRHQTGFQSEELVVHPSSKCWGEMAANDERLAGLVVVDAQDILAAVTEADTFGGKTRRDIRLIAEAFMNVVGQPLSVDSGSELPKAA